MCTDVSNRKVCNIPLFLSNPPELTTVVALLLGPLAALALQPGPLVPVEVLPETLVATTSEPLVGMKLLPVPTASVVVPAETPVALPLEPGHRAVGELLLGPPVSITVLPASCPLGSPRLPYNEELMFNDRVYQ